MPDELVETYVRIPIRSDDLAQIEAKLRADDLFSTSFQHLGPVVYEAATYIREQCESETQVRMLVDRNLLSPLVALGRGDTATTEQRRAAALLAFAQTLDVLIEPNIALYELEGSSMVGSADRELMVFRQLDNTHPQVLADVAVGRTSSLDLTQVPVVAPPKLPKVNFEMRLRTWRVGYVVALKIATLARAKGRAVDKMAQVMHWMQRDFLWSGPGLFLACNAFAPHQRGPGMLRGTGSRDASERLSWARNAAWDLALVYTWLARLDRQAADNQLWILASADRQVRRVARALMAATYSPESSETILKRQFLSTWGPAFGERLFREYQAHAVEREADGQRRTTSLAPDRIRSMIADLEAQVVAGR